MNEVKKSETGEGEAPRKTYLIEKKFVGGLLDGITIKEETNVRYPVGFACATPVAGSPYIILSVQEL